jgi:hypothetical protein
VTCWGSPPEALAADTDQGLVIHGVFRMSSGLECQIFGTPTSARGVDAWTEDALIRWDWAPPELFQGFDDTGARRRLEPEYAPYSWSEFGYLTGSIHSFLAAGAGEPSSNQKLICHSADNGYRVSGLSGPKEMINRQYFAFFYFKSIPLSFSFVHCFTSTDDGK